MFKNKWKNGGGGLMMGRIDDKLRKVRDEPAEKRRNRRKSRGRRTKI